MLDFGADRVCDQQTSLRPLRVSLPRCYTDLPTDAAERCCGAHQGSRGLEHCILIEGPGILRRRHKNENQEHDITDNGHSERPVVYCLPHAFPQRKPPSNPARGRAGWQDGRFDSRRTVVAGYRRAHAVK